MPDFSALVFFLTAAVFVSLLSVSLGALGGLVGALWPQRLARAQESWNGSSLLLGLVHTLALLVLLNVGEHRPLVKLISLAWLLVYLLASLLGVAALVRHLAWQLFPTLARPLALLAAGATVAWAIAFPFAGQVLGLGLLSTAYAAGLAGWMRKAQPRNPEPVSEPPARESESNGGH